MLMSRIEAVMNETEVTAWLDAHPHFCMQYYSKKYGSSSLLVEPFMERDKEIQRRRSVPVKKFTRKELQELKKMDRHELIMELVRDIANDLDVNSLSHKILVNVNILLNADRSSLFLREGEGENYNLVSRLFDVREGSSVAESIHAESEAIRIRCGVGIVGYVAQTKEIVNIADAYQVCVCMHACVDAIHNAICQHVPVRMNDLTKMLTR